MFNQHEAKVDSYFSSFAVVIIAGIVSFAMFSAHFPTGTKYFLLSHFGVTTDANLQSVSPVKGVGPIDYGFRRFERASAFEYRFAFHDHSGNRHTGAIMLADGKTGGVRTEFVRTRQSVPIVYFDYWPPVLLPQPLLPSFELDMKIMLGSLFATLILALVLFTLYRSYVRFGVKNSSY